MKRRVMTNAVVWCFSIGIIAGSAIGQSLTDKLKEEESFYTNFGKETYSKLKIEKDVVGKYDLFGAHIVDGVHLYELSNENSRLTNEREGIEDSVAYSRSKEYQKRDFYEKFSNLVITQDAIGGVKTSFLIGDQITTRFTPLTFNKTNFRGIRWDLWSSGLQMSMLMSRTRPGWTATKEADGTGEALVEYPITENSFGKEYYMQAMRGDRDFSNKSPFGDYDFLWAVHAENTIANKIDVGLTYINHHVNDVEKGANPFKGDLPDSLMPKAIHFEFFDLTPEDTADAGVYVEQVVMMVNGQEVEAKDAYRDTYRRVYVGDRDNILLPRDIPLARPQSGRIPIIVEFKTEPRYWRFKKASASERDRDLASLRDVKQVKFSYTVAGNYLVFVSTDRQISTAIAGQWNPQTRRVDYWHPSKSVEQIYENGKPIDASGGSDAYNFDRLFAATYYGEYIAQSPRPISVSDVEFTSVVDPANRTALLHGNQYKYNYRTYQWEYNLNVSSVTYGANFKGELFGVKFNGEVALNQSTDMLPGSPDSATTVNKWVGTFKAERELGKKFGLNGELYFISPQWMTNLDNLQTSRYFNKTTFKSGTSGTSSDAAVTERDYDYTIYPHPLGNEWYNIDDNDDKDPFVESDRRRYPSDLDATSDRDKFYNDGSLKSGTGKLETVTLPSGMKVPYDDPDGVVASKNDKNKNGEPDYTEDFLLFSSDPPVFDLGIDLNNNNIPDYEDDDILPDFGHSVGYVITGDGIRTQGIRGLNLNFRWTPIDNTVLDLGGTIENVVDRDLVLETSSIDEDVREGREGKSYVVYLTAKNEVLRRSQGIQYNLGAEVRGVFDAIRNDAIVPDYELFDELYNVDYYYYYDELDFRQAAVGNLVGGITYNNIRNFEYGFRTKIGVEKHFPIDSVEQVFYSPWSYDQKWKPYHDRLISDFHVVNRLQYKIRFNFDYEDWRSVFNFMNRLEFIPQYKLAFSMRKELSGPEETQVDPRDIRKHLEMDIDGDNVIDPVLDDYLANLDSVEAARSRWKTYRKNNVMYLLNVPIIRANFKVAENTEFQLGSQWLRYLNVVSPEGDKFKYTILAQIVSKANYKGYNVTFFLGGRWQFSKFDINQYDPVLDMGSPYNINGYEFFAKLYSGI